MTHQEIIDKYSDLHESRITVEYGHVIIKWDEGRQFHLVVIPHKSKNPLREIRFADKHDRDREFDKFVLIYRQKGEEAELKTTINIGTNLGNLTDCKFKKPFTRIRMSDIHEYLENNLTEEEYSSVKVYGWSLQ